MDTQQLLSTNMMTLLGLQNLPAERQQNLADRMMRVVQQRIAERVIGAMTDEQRAHFDALNDSHASPDEINDFMKTVVPNIDEVTAEEVLKFKQEMVENTQAVRDQLAA